MRCALGDGCGYADARKENLFGLAKGFNSLFILAGIEYIQGIGKGLFGILKDLVHDLCGGVVCGYPGKGGRAYRNIGKRVLHLDKALITELSGKPCEGGLGAAGFLSRLRNGHARYVYGAGNDQVCGADLNMSYCAFILIAMEFGSCSFIIASPVIDRAITEKMKVITLYDYLFDFATI